MHNSDHISNYLHFQNQCDEVKPWHETVEVATTSTGTKVVRKETRKGRVFQLWLNESEYNTLKQSGAAGRHAEFYGGWYVYLGPYSRNIIEISKLLGWKNPHKN